jgi:hypothetical protein
MKTRPDYTIDEHIERLLTVLEERVPNVRQYELRFVDAAAMVRVGNEWVVPASKVMLRPEFDKFFEGLCELGYPWINLAGDAPWRGAFLVWVEHGIKAGSTETAVNVSGPSVDIAEKPFNQSVLRIEET